MEASEIHDKLIDSSNPDKPAEFFELAEEIFRKIGNCHMPIGINTKIAGEIADVVYYGLQPNVKEEDSLNHYYNYLFGPAHIPPDSILAFCIVKYSTRLVFGDKPDYKMREFDKLSLYLIVHPELTKIWNPTNAIQAPETIWEHVGGWD